MQEPRVITSFTEIVENYDAFIFDCDGVLWTAGQKIEQAFQALSILQKKDKSIFFLTNNSTSSRMKYVHKLKGYGFETSEERIYSSSYVAPAYIKEHFPEVKKLYVIGMEGLVEEAKAAGFEVVGGPADNGKRLASEHEFTQMPFEKDIDAILVGYDMDMTYYKLAYASACLQTGAKFFATNADPYDMAGGMKIPTAGTTLAALETSNNVKPLVMGKPNRHSIDLIAEHHSIDKSRCIMIGDRIDTDILVGKNAGVDTCLVFTGVYTEDMLLQELKKEDSIVPDYVCKGVCIE